MEISILFDLLKQAPGLLACVIIVIIFVKHITKSDNALLKVVKENSEIIGKTKTVLSNVEVHLIETKQAVSSWKK